MKKVIVVQRIDPGSDELKNKRQLAELKDLAYAAGYSVVGEIIQSRYPDKKYQFGKGKVQELALEVESLNADKVIFCNELSSMQLYNITDICKCAVIDKFQLILEIFALRATTRRAKLQVELARLEYEIPRARIIVSHLKKEERPGFMGLGSYEDSYEQDIKGRIARIKDELSHVQSHNESLRSFRHAHGFSLVALAGYTNAGKSTLFNTLMNEGVDVADMLFTTLSPIARSMDVMGRKVVLTDTVGFIEDLPHWLIDAFRSTLNEIFFADIILLVVDASEPLDIMHDKLLTCHDTLWEQVHDASMITVLNKTDLISREEINEKMEALGYLVPNPVYISAKVMDGLDGLRQAIRDKLPVWKRKEISMPLSEHSMSVLSWLFKEGVVHSVKYTDQILVDLEAREEVMNKVKSFSDV
ncbi:GTPase HflX [Methanomethylovorans sp.]|uniref:GTPase HflX n=1 Tax=Methanomethylovorans sp. TaxID=2758717 RepID=UPI00351C698C